MSRWIFRAANGKGTKDRFEMAYIKKFVEQSFGAGRLRSSLASIPHQYVDAPMQLLKIAVLSMTALSAQPKIRMICIKLHQQSKNLRLTTSNLFSLNTKFGLEFTVAMDFVRNSGYLYLLRLVDHGLGLDDCIAVAHFITDLVIPTTIESLSTVKNTLRGSSRRYYLESQIATAQASTSFSLEGICLTSSISPPQCKSPFIFFTPRNNRVQKHNRLSSCHTQYKHWRYTIDRAHAAFLKRVHSELPV
ncbi:uncharacterized protein BYT42DRAFT_278134 [Radiomyces spectabilis]|uniref:uncharacterized protein n=1 Tax=Radiomyces spectabilis TaxID=64574 RepID=UPI002221236F|nr:uncharacterized protein BYT42DRAFT_278134 [Radiomyces spectabilis]KAI8384887.1 hypothetical protein BYT42DRAFT_278134 [Radiomyces spectabilis]